jgi:hypothetical protein
LLSAAAGSGSGVGAGWLSSLMGEGAALAASAGAGAAASAGAGLSFATADSDPSSGLVPSTFPVCDTVISDGALPLPGVSAGFSSLAGVDLTASVSLGLSVCEDDPPVSG